MIKVKFIDGIYHVHQGVWTGPSLARTVAFQAVDPYRGHDPPTSDPDPDWSRANTAAALFRGEILDYSPPPTHPSVVH